MICSNREAGFFLLLLLFFFLEKMMDKMVNFLSSRGPVGPSWLGVKSSIAVLPMWYEKQRVGKYIGNGGRIRV